MGGGPAGLEAARGGGAADADGNPATKPQNRDRLGSKSDSPPPLPARNGLALAVDWLEQQVRAGNNHSGPRWT